METIENRTFDEIQVGESASIQRRLTCDDIKLFAAMSGDVNPAHMDEEYADNSMFQGIIAHGMWGGSLVSTVLGTKLPGPGTIYLGQSFKFHRPVRLGDIVTVTVTAKEKNVDKHHVLFDCECTNEACDIVISGTAEVIAPNEKISRPRVRLPEVRLHERLHLHRLMDAAKQRPAIATAVVHPVERTALLGAIGAATTGLIDPVLIGPERKIKSVADAEDIDITHYKLIGTEHSHAAAQTAVAMAANSEVQSIMKGALHTDELMHAVLDRSAGLRTERRVSHIFAFDVPTYPRPLFITDAAININPDLDDLHDIVQNAIDLAHALQVEKPKVALLSAVETVTPRLESTLRAAALCKMADRGQIQGALLDGPLAFDNAVSTVAANIKGIDSEVAGEADILVVPDLESGNMLAKQLEYLADAEGAGIVLGARVPIILTSRADDTVSRMASCALALLWAQRTDELRT